MTNKIIMLDQQKYLDEANLIVTTFFFFGTIVLVKLLLPCEHDTTEVNSNSNSL